MAKAKDILPKVDGTRAKEKAEKAKAGGGPEKAKEARECTGSI